MHFLEKSQSTIRSRIPSSVKSKRCILWLSELRIDLPGWCPYRVTFPHKKAKPADHIRYIGKYECM